jgi:hypothetical protein
MSFHDDVDEALSKGIEALQAKHEKAMGTTAFSSQVTGIMLATAIRTAKLGGCPRKILEGSILAKIEEEYGNA